MTVTSYVQSSVRESVISWEGCTWSDDTFGQESQRLRGLEGRTRRILSHDTTVQERFPRILGEPLMHLSSVLTHQLTRVVGW